MKKITLLLAVVLISIGAFAQYQAGNVLVNGTFVFGSSQDKMKSGGTTSEGPKYTSFEIAPGFEYFLSEKLAVGAELGFGLDKDEEDDGVDVTVNKTTMTSIAPFAAMYFINEEKFALFCKAELGFGFGKHKTEVTPSAGGATVTTESDMSGMEIGIKPGIAVHLSEKFGMTATFGAVGYRSYKEKAGTIEYSSSEFGLEITPSLGFGLYYKLK